MRETMNTTPAAASAQATKAKATRRFGFVIESEARAKALAEEELRIQGLHRKANAFLEKLADECQLPEVFESLRNYDLGDQAFHEISKDLQEILRRDCGDVYLRELGIETYLERIFTACDRMRENVKFFGEGMEYIHEFLSEEETKILDEVPESWEPHLTRSVFCIAMYAEHCNLLRMIDEHDQEMKAADFAAFMEGQATKYGVNKEVL